MDAKRNAAWVAAPAAETDQLEAHVRSQLIGRVRDFRLVFQGKGLVLQGLAPTYYAKQLAQHAVMQMTKAPILANDILVAGAVDRQTA